MSVFTISDLTLERLKRFRAMKRAWWSFLALCIAYLVSLTANFWIGETPLLVRYEGQTFRPHSLPLFERDFGGEYLTKPNYRKLKASDRFAEGSGNFMVMPALLLGPLTADLDKEGRPPLPRVTGISWERTAPEEICSLGLFMASVSA